jgi:hypothetical protein
MPGKEPTTKCCFPLLAFLAFACGPSQAAEPFPLWDAARPVPKAAEIPQLSGIEFYVIKRGQRSQQQDSQNCE